MRMLFQSAALVGLFAAQALAQSNTTHLDDLDNHNSTTAEDLESLTPEEFDELKKGNSTVLEAILSSNITLDEYNRTLTQLNTSSPQTLKINGVNYTLADLRNQNFTTPRPPISNSTELENEALRRGRVQLVAHLATKIVHIQRHSRHAMRNRLEAAARGFQDSRMA